MLSDFPNQCSKKYGQRPRASRSNRMGSESTR
jgi:hypothetical protein